MILAAALLLAQPAEAGDFLQYPHTPVERSLDDAYTALIDASGYLCRADARTLRRHADLDRQYFALLAEAQQRLGRSLYQTIRTRACEHYRAGRVASAWARARRSLHHAQAQMADLPSPAAP